MFTEPEIISTSDLSTRAYVKVYIDGERHRFYNGKDLGINCNPNRAKSVAERNKALNHLQYQLKKHLEKGWSPAIIKLPPTPKKVIVSAGQAFNALTSEIENEQISDDYKRDLRLLNDHFIEYLKKNDLTKLPVESITADQIEAFLSKFKTSPTNYMSRRRTLSALFFRVKGKKHILSNPTKETKKIKEVPHLNVPFKKDQMKDVLDYIKSRNTNLYICCLLMYGCLLRPHEEIRFLTRGAFDEDLTKISLGGNENKSKKIRNVFVPDYVRNELIRCNIHELAENINIFSHSTSHFAKSYFNTIWSRIKDDLLEKELITENHTPYSFRHSAAVNMYLKTKDPYKVQRALGHSSLLVTLVYLRSLGLIVDASVNDLPELPV
jgi:integrase